MIGDKEIVIATDVPHEPISMYTDRIKLKQILINIISNSIKFTVEGRITLSIMEEKTPIQPIPHDDPVSQYLSILIKDTGIGIDMDHVEYIFDAFWQADRSLSRSTDGAGLGLTITKMLVHLLCGGIHVVSEKGVGTTVTLTIPTRLSVNDCG